MFRCTIFLLLFFVGSIELFSQPLHEYFFNGNLNGTNGGPTLVQETPCGAAVGAFGVQTVAVVGQTCTASNVFCFNDGGGLRYNNPNYITNQYTIHMFFKFNTLGGYARIIDFRNSASDNGAYLLNNCLNFYPTGNVGTCPNFIANTYYLFTFVRNGATNIVTVYVNGVLFTTYNDAANDYRCATNVTPIKFFRDDNVVTCENQPGCIRYASVISTTSNPTQVMSTFTNICNVILPVELSSFNAEEKDNLVHLNWTTTTEKNNSHFEIERSSDGFNFEKINEIKGRGNSQEKIQYNMVDHAPVIGTSYYRLKQVDLDGSFEYSQIRAVVIDDEKVSFFFPNPAKGDIYFRNLESKSNVIIQNMLGQIVLNETINESNKISTESLENGTYMIRYGNKVQKLIINK